MPVIQSPRQQRRLQQALELEGSPPAPTVSPEIVPVIITDDLSPGAQGGPSAVGIPPIDPADPFTPIQYEKFSNSPAVAGQYSQNVFVNPRGSGIMAMITQWTGTSNGDFSQAVFIATSTAVIPSTLVAGERGYMNDGRLLPVGSDPVLTNLSQCGIFTASTPTAVNARRSNIKTGPSFASNTPGDIRYINYIVRPNMQVTFWSTALNEPIWTYLLWSERAVFPGENDGTL